MTDDTEVQQRNVCKEHGAEFLPAPTGLKIGIAENVRQGIQPINGLRHPPQGDTTGWYIWAGEEMLDAPDYFKPLHVDHIKERCPEIEKYLGLPPGWRFLIAGDYEDVWYDKSLLDV